MRLPALTLAMPIGTRRSCHTKFNLRTTAGVESFWEARWLSIRPFLCFKKHRPSRCPVAQFTAVWNSVCYRMILGIKMHSVTIFGSHPMSALCNFSRSFTGRLVHIQITMKTLKTIKAMDAMKTMNAMNTKGYYHNASTLPFYRDMGTYGNQRTSAGILKINGI